MEQEAKEHHWFECKVNFDKTAETSGVLVNTSECYLVEAVNFTDAEVRATVRAMEASEHSSDIVVESVKRVRIAEFVGEVAPTGKDKWFKAKVNYLTIREDGTVKRKGTRWMVRAKSLFDAFNFVAMAINSAAFDIEAASLSTTDIVDVLPVYEHDTSELVPQIN